MDAWLNSPHALRLLLAVVGLATAVAVERLLPFRSAGANGMRREFRHLTLWAIGAGLVLGVSFATALGAAEAARLAGFGLLNRWSLPDPAAILVTVLVLDVWTYALHRLYHGVPILWRLHRVHHSDESLTATTGIRFHPAEVLLSALLRIPVVLLLGASVSGVVVFEIVLLAASQFQHADIRLPDRWARTLGAVLITPNLHRTHHSVLGAEADSNFGTISSVWDRLFATLRLVRPEQVAVGPPEDRGPLPADPSLLRLLSMPFVG